MVHDERPTAGPTAETTSAQLDQLSARLRAEHSCADPERIDALVREGWERTADAKVQSFRLVLAERHARDVLRAERPTTTT